MNLEKEILLMIWKAMRGKRGPNEFNQGEVNIDRTDGRNTQKILKKA